MKMDAMAMGGLSSIAIQAKRVFIIVSLVWLGIAKVLFPKYSAKNTLFLQPAVFRSFQPVVSFSLSDLLSSKAKITYLYRDLSSDRTGII